MTSLTVLQNRPNSPPECFGSHLWDPKSAECTGGADLTYTNPKTGSHVREKCQFFESCGAKVQATKMAAARAIIPQTPQLPQMVQPTPWRPVTSGAASRVQVPQMSQQMQPVQQQQPMGPMMMGPWYPATTYQFNHGLPDYLSVPEPRLPGESIWPALIRSVLRGLLKATGHTIAQFADVNSLQHPPKNE